MIVKAVFRSFLLALAVAWICTSSVNANELSTSNPGRFAELEYSLFGPFFEALVLGDVNVIKKCLSDREYARHARLLESNAAYPEYLRDHYKGASFVLKEIVDENEVLTGRVEIFWGDGRQTEMEIRLIENSTR